MHGFSSFTSQNFIFHCSVDYQLRGKYSRGKKALPIIEEQISLTFKVLDGLILAFLKSMLLGNVYKERIILQCEKMQMAIMGGNVEEWC